MVYSEAPPTTATVQSFDLFVYIIGAMVLLLTGFSPRRSIPLIVGSVALMSSSDYLTAFLAIELQSNGLFHLTGTVHSRPPGPDLNLQGIGVMASLYPVFALPSPPPNICDIWGFSAVLRQGKKPRSA